MATLTFADAAYLPDPLPNADGFCFYIGGDTPHVYTDAEVAKLKAKYQYLLPIFTRSDPAGPGASADVASAVARLKALGVPQGVLVAWDSETSADPSYMRSVYADLHAAGYVLIDYGSQSSLFGNDNPDGYYWGADWTGAPHIASRDEMTQWVSLHAYDEELAESSLPFWSMKARPPVPTVQVTVPAPVLQQGMSDPVDQIYFVRRVQVLAAGIGSWNSLGAVTSVADDGVFGPGTEAAVIEIQRFFGLTEDGVVGQSTWTKLLGG